MIPTDTTGKAQVIRTACLDMQVCVPDGWTDEEIRKFANMENPCETESGWQIRTDEESLAGCPYRNPCAEIKGFIHVTLDA